MSLFPQVLNKQKPAGTASGGLFGGGLKSAVEGALGNIPQKSATNAQVNPPQIQGMPQAGGAAGGLPNIQGVNMTPINPNQDLRGVTFTPGQTADRYQIASQRIQDFDKQEEPMFRRDIDSVNSAGASRGQLSSGQLNTSLGNVVAQRDNSRALASQGFLRDAMERSIDDVYRNIGVGQQERAYQTGQQQNAFQQQMQSMGLADSLQDSELRRALSKYQVGDKSSLEAMRLRAADRYDDNAASMSGGLRDLIGGRMDSTSEGQSLDRIRQILGY